MSWTADGVTLARRLDGPVSALGKSWDWDLGSVRVSQRRTGSFSITTVELGRALRCTAFGKQTVLCPVGIHGGVTLPVANRDTKCVAGENWGLSERGV